MSNPSPSELTVLVFKDNDSSRTFRVPLSWIARFGFTIAALVATALLSSFFAVKFYRVARRTDPAHVVDLEQELSELKKSNRGLEVKVAALPLPVPVPTVTVAAPAVMKPTVQAPPSPAATVAASSSSVAPIGALTLFSAFPKGTLDLSSKATSLPISVSPAKTTWRGKTLKVDFNIQYTGTEKQQGRLILLARGPGSLFAYPDGVLNRAGAESLISPQQGEYFSVSRFREVNAEFGPVKATSDIKDVEVMILSLDGQLLFYQKITPTPTKPPVEKTTAAKPVPKPAPATSAAPVAPAAPTSEIIEPGVDQ